jgi:osmotically-inducible protein OsmY
MGSRLRSSPLADGELAEQVRQAATGITSQLGSLHISVQNGHVTISGPILADKMQVLVERIARLPGVRAVDNRLTVYQTAGDIPLQGSEGYGAP